jgi:hypothetical protein
MALRIATFNAENLFRRPKVFPGPSGPGGMPTPA